MNILLVCKLADHTIVENVLLPLLSTNNVEHIYVLRDKIGDEIGGKVTYLCPKEQEKSKWRHVRKIWRGICAIPKYKIGAIIGVLNTPHGYIGRMIGFLTHTPYVHMTIAGHREFWMYGKKLEKMNLWVFGSAAAITVTGHQTQHYLEQNGIKKDKIFVLPNLPNEAFTKIQLNEKRHYDIISFSRIDLNKNVILLIKALSKLKDKFNLKVAIAGDGDQLENIKNLAKELDVDSMIEFFGYVSGFENKVKLLSDSKIFISCSRGEGFPVSLLEAMNCGCVPVVSNVGDIIDVIKNGKNGFIYNDTENETEFVKYLELLLSNEDRISSLSHEAYKIKDHISIANNGRIWDEVFASVIR